MTRRFWIGLVLTLPVFVLEMGSHLVDIHRLIDPSVSGYRRRISSGPCCSRTRIISKRVKSRGVRLGRGSAIQF
jgi:hypothetical protein